MHTRRVAVLYTGGTIGMMHGPRGYEPRAGFLAIDLWNHLFGALFFVFLGAQILPLLMAQTQERPWLESLARRAFRRRAPEMRFTSTPQGLRIQPITSGLETQD